MKINYIPLISILLFNTSFSQLPLDKWPAARLHVVKKEVNGQESFFKRTSKLKRLNNYNFSCTAVGSHNLGNEQLDTFNDKVAADYGEGGEPGFEIVHYTTGNSYGNGTANGDYAKYLHVDTLRKADVAHYVSVSHMNRMDCMSDETRQHIRDAVVDYGVGFLGSHGTGDGGSGQGTQWKFFLDTINPGDPNGHGTREERTQVYVSQKFRNHLAIENVIVEGQVTDRTDLLHVTTDGQQETLDTPFRWVRFEPYRYRKEIEDFEFVKVLMKYNPNEISDIPDYTNFEGANNFSWIVEAGMGRLGYFPMGHIKRELDDFDGLIDNVNDEWHGGESSNDMVRYTGQLLFFLAGYDETECDESCDGLPLVDYESDFILGTHTVSINDKNSKKFLWNYNDLKLQLDPSINYTVQLMNASGKKIKSFPKSSSNEIDFTKENLSNGIYFVNININNKQPHLLKMLVFK